jgi:hypothetical protein
MGLGRAMGRQPQLQYHLAKYHFRFYDINSLAITKEHLRKRDEEEDETSIL